MPKKTTQLTSVCPIARTAAVVGDTWILLIIRDLIDKPSRFSELLQSLQPISSRTLTKKLQLLEKQQLVKRQAFHEIPPRVEYRLTTNGRALKKIITSLFDYGQHYLSN